MDQFTPAAEAQFSKRPSSHAYGGARMGDNRETKGVDRFGFAHEVPNLGILGASVMGTSGAHNRP